LEAIVNSISELFAAVLGRFGHVGRARGRTNIRQDLDLLEQLREAPEFGADSRASSFLVSHITSEVAEYSGHVPPRKRPWGAITLSLLIGLPLAIFAYNLSSDGFDWFSLLLGAGALLMLAVAIQLLTEDKEADEADAAKSPGPSS
jgi:hypothetical protein